MAGLFEANLLDEVVGYVQAYVGGRLSVLRADAARAESNGNVDDAIEGYVRYLIGGGAQADEAVRGHIDELLKRARGVEGIRIQP